MLDLGSISGLGSSPGEGKGYPLQYSSLENSMDCILHRVAKSRTRLSDFHKANIPKYLAISNVYLGFPGGSDGKESTCNEGHLGSIPELGRAPGEGKGYHSSILAWRIPWTVQSIGSQRV